MIDGPSLASKAVKCEPVSCDHGADAHRGGPVSTVAAYVLVVGGIICPAILVAYWFAVVRNTAAGEDELAVSPEEVGSMSTWVIPLVRYFLVLGVAAAPLVLAETLLPSDLAPVGRVIGGVIGFVYLPAALLIAAHGSGCLGALNPIPAIQLIVSIPGAYFTTLGMLTTAGVASVPLVYVAVLLAEDGGGFFRFVAFGLLTMIGPIVMARMLGILVREHQIAD